MDEEDREILENGNGVTVELREFPEGKAIALIQGGGDEPDIILVPVENARALAAMILNFADAYDA